MPHDWKHESSKFIERADKHMKVYYIKHNDINHFKDMMKLEHNFV